MTISVKSRFLQIPTCCEVCTPNFLYPLVALQPAGPASTPASPVSYPIVLEKGGHGPHIGHIGTL